MRASVERFSLPLRAPLETARRSLDSRDGFLLRVGTDPPGLGEASPLTGFTEGRESCRGALADAAAALRDGEPATALASAERAPAARHAVALALADRAARGDREPLATHLDAGADAAVPVNATVGDAEAGTTADRAAAAVADGVDCIKVKVGARSVAEDAGRLRAVRDAVGDGVTLRADANGAWDRPTVERAIEAFADPGVTYVEQPLPAADLEGHAGLRGGPVAVALDESLADASVATVLDAGAADVVVLKPMALGGPDRVSAAAAAAREAGVTPVVTTTYDGLVGRLGAVHAAASLGGLPPCGLATADALAADFGPDPAPVDSGQVVVPDAPGLGVDPTEVAPP